MGGRKSGDEGGGGQQQFSIVGGERGRSFCIYIGSCLCLFLFLSLPPPPLYLFLSLALFTLLLTSLPHSLVISHSLSPLSVLMSSYFFLSTIIIHLSVSIVCSIIFIPKVFPFLSLFLYFLPSPFLPTLLLIIHKFIFHGASHLKS